MDDGNSDKKDKRTKKLTYEEINKTALGSKRDRKVLIEL